MTVNLVLLLANFFLSSNATCCGNEGEKALFDNDLFRNAHLGGKKIRFPFSIETTLHFSDDVRPIRMRNVNENYA